MIIDYMTLATKTAERLTKDMKRTLVFLLLGGKYNILFICVNFQGPY